MHSDIDIELLSVTEGKQVTPVAANKDSESIAPVDSDCDGS